MKILYFAWIKKSLNISEERINLPKDVKNVRLLVNLLSNKSQKHKAVFSKIKSMKIAINHNIGCLNTKIKKNDEVAFFPPFTGG